MTSGEWELQLLYGRIKAAMDERDRLKKENMEIRHKLARYMVALRQLGYTVCDNCGATIDVSDPGSHFEYGPRTVCAKCLYEDLNRMQKDKDKDKKKEDNNDGNDD